MCPTPASSIARALACEISRPPTITCPETGRRRPVIASISSVWPFPSTPARPTISPACTVSETPLHGAQPALVVDLEVSHLQQRLAGLCRLLFHAEQHLAPDHHAREARLGRALARNGVDPLAAPQDRDPVGDLEHLVQLVADEDDRRALLLEALDDPEQLARLLRGQHGGRLVEDQDLGAAVEGLQDLDALLLPDADASPPSLPGRRRDRTGRRFRARALRRRCSRAGRRPSSARRPARCSRRRS